MPALHCLVALLALNIPARYTTGYLGDIGVPVARPMDFSAWFEVFLGDRWYTSDARHNARRIGRIVMARGRDAGDVPITMCFGPSSLLRFDVITDEVVEPKAAAAPPRAAASTSLSEGDIAWPRHRARTRSRAKATTRPAAATTRRAASSPSPARSSRRRATPRPDDAREAEDMERAEAEGKSHAKGEDPLLNQQRKARRLISAWRAPASARRGRAAVATAAADAAPAGAAGGTCADFGLRTGARDDAARARQRGALGCRSGGILLRRPDR